MKIKWLGHSCFKIEEDGYSLVLDPYKKSAMLRLDTMHAEANEVLTSHEHEDHNFVQAVDIVKTDKKSPFVIKRLATYHDEHKGKKRGSNYITIIQAGKLKVAHLGDLGCELTETEIKELKNLDALMLPIGGFFTIGPKEAKVICDKLEPKVIIPMHYKGKKAGPLMLSKLKTFTNLFDKKELVRYQTDFIDLQENMENQVAILNHPEY